MRFNHICGIILAGGKSSRMGRNKANLKIDQHDFLAQAYQLLSACELGTIVVSGNYPDYPCVPDLKPYFGPAASILSVWNKVQAASLKKLVICAIDMPLMTPSLIELLINASEHHEAVFFEKNFLPCCINTGALEKVKDQNFDNQALQSLLNQFTIKQLPISLEQQNYFANINTPADWQDNWSKMNP